MRTMRLLMVTAAAGVALALTGCGVLGGGARTVDDESTEVMGDLSADASALVAMGFAPADVDAVPAAAPAGAPAPAGTPTAAPDRDRRHPLRVRVMLRRNTLHGEAVVQTKDGTTKTIVVQRGTVTAINDTSITVKSTDGFTLTWTFGNPMHVIEHRTTIQATDVAVGAEVGVAGGKDGATTTARLIVIPNRR